MSADPHDRRALIAGLGVAATTITFGARGALAQGTPVFTPARHDQDAWMSAMPGKHRVVLDIVTPVGVPDGIRFAGNLFNGSKSGYGLEDAEMAIIMVLRHTATVFGFSDVIWSKYGKQLDAKATPPPVANPYNSGERQQLSGLAKRGVQFIICGSASRLIAGRLAGTAGDSDAVLKELGANLIPNGRTVSAGVVGVAHAQEHGFSLLYVG